MDKSHYMFIGIEVCWMSDFVCKATERIHGKTFVWINFNTTAKRETEKWHWGITTLEKNTIVFRYLNTKQTSKCFRTREINVHYINKYRTHWDTDNIALMQSSNTTHYLTTRCNVVPEKFLSSSRTNSPLLPKPLIGQHLELEFSPHVKTLILKSILILSYL